MALKVNVEARERRLAERQTTGGHDKGPKGPKLTEEQREELRAPHPFDRPCFPCGTAGYCRHRPAPVSHG